MAAAAIGLRRLSSQRVAGERCATPEEVVRRMGALQAQAYGQALWAIGARTQSATLADVERAIAERRILLTWPLRGTLHVIPAEDARWMLKVSASRTLRAARRRRDQLGLDETTIARCAELFRAALAGGKRLTRASMMQLLGNAGVDPSGQRGYHILWQTAQAGVICLGPMEGAQQTFVLLDEWVSNARDLPREEAVAALARRYFTSHGPATVHDFAWWAGLTLTEARAGLDAVRSHLLVDQRNGGDCGDYWTGAEDRDDHHDTSAVYLLPGFDEYILGYTDRRDVLAPEHAAKIVPGNNGIFLPTIVAAGRVVGAWTRKRTKAGLDIALQPFAPLAASDTSIAEAAQRYGAFLGSSVASIDGAGVAEPVESPAL